MLARRLAVGTPPKKLFSGALHMRILAIEDYCGAFQKSQAFERLRSLGHDIHCDPRPLRGEEIVRASFGYDALWLTQQRTPLPESVILRLPPSVRWIMNTGKNMSHLDTEACKKQGIQIVKAGGGGSQATAQHTWALILASARHIIENNKSVHAGTWQSALGMDLSGKTLGLLGLGNIGKIVASVGATFGMRVLCHGREGGSSAADAAACGYEFAKSRDDLFRHADVLCVHQKYSGETHGSITRAHLGLMKPNSIFVNTARAGIVEQGALAAALRHGRPGSAAIDVYEEEPAAADEELLQLPNVLCTPHLGYATADNLEKYYRDLAEAFLQHPLHSKI